MAVKKKPEYPLAQVLQVKKKRVEDAEKVVVERQEALEKENKRLEEVQAARDAVAQHRANKLAQLRQSLDEGTTSPEVQLMKRYLEVVKDNVAVEDEKIVEQKKQVAQAERNLEQAKELLKERRMEVDKLETHQKDWKKQSDKEQRAEEAKQEQEMGSDMFLSKKFGQRRGR